MNEENQNYQKEENGEIDDYDDEDEYEEGDFRPSYPRLNWPFTILSAIVLQAGALGALKDNIYLIVGSTLLAGICASCVTWKEKMENTTYTPHPNKYKLFFAFAFIVGVGLCVLAAIRTTVR